MTETNLPDWLMQKGIMMNPEVLHMLEAINQFTNKHGIKTLKMLVVEE